MIRALLFSSVLLGSAAALADPPPTAASPAGARYTLPQLVAESQRAHPTVAAAEQGLESSRQQLAEAQRAWWPSLSLTGLVAPSVDVRCSDAGLLHPVPGPDGQLVPGAPVRSSLCLGAYNDVRNPLQAYPTGLLTRWEVQLAMPLYTFGKLAGAADAANAGVRVSQERLEATRQDLVVNIARAYYGLKVARELLDMIHEGRAKLEDAIKDVEEGLNKGRSNAAETDRLRLRVAETLVDSRALEAEKGERMARAALKTLVPTAPDNVDVDAAPIEAVELVLRPVEFYVDAAHEHRPEARMVRDGVVAARANKNIAVSNLLPDVALLGSVFWLWKTTEDDDPFSPYMSHPFADYGYGGGLVVRWGLDLHLKVPRLFRARADYEGALASGRAAQDGMDLEVKNVYESVAEAKKRMEILLRGEKASRSWLTAIAQNYAIGAAEAREFNDALIAYFEAHGRYLQAIYDFNTAAVQLSRSVGIDVTLVK